MSRSSYSPPLLSTPSSSTPFFPSHLYSTPINSNQSESSTHSPSRASSSVKGGPKPDNSYGVMPNSKGKEFVPPTPIIGQVMDNENAVGAYNPDDNTIKLDKGLSETARKIVTEHETAHAAHATYLPLFVTDDSPKHLEEVAENMLLTELAAYQRQAIATLKELEEGWNPVGTVEGSKAAMAKLYLEDPAGFRRNVLMTYARHYQPRFTGLDGTDGKPINLTRIAERLLSEYK